MLSSGSGISGGDASAARTATLAEAATPAAFVADLLEHWPDARIKAYVTACGLRLRRTHPDLCVLGDYVPLRADDVGEDHLVAFARRHGEAEVVAVVPRTTRRIRRPGQWLPVGAPVWGTSRLILPPDAAGAVYRHVFTGEVVGQRDDLAGRVAEDAGAAGKRKSVARITPSRQFSTACCSRLRNSRTLPGKS